MINCRDYFRFVLFRKFQFENDETLKKTARIALGGFGRSGGADCSCVHHTSHKKARIDSGEIPLQRNVILSHFFSILES